MQIDKNVFCCFCDFKTKEIKCHLEHHRFHRNVTSNFHCGFEKCTKFFEIEKSLRSHLSRKHNVTFKRKQTFDSDDKIANKEAKYICTLDMCRKGLNNYSLLIKHLKTHINDNLKVKCPYENCNKSYNNVNLFTGNLSKKHRTIFKKNSDHR